MKKFDGIHPYAYETIFGIINIDPYITTDDRQHWFVVKKVTETPIRYPAIIDHERVVGLRRFENRSKAYQYINGLEVKTFNEVNNIFVDILSSKI